MRKILNVSQLILMNFVFASDTNQGPGDEFRRPPREAVEACRNLEVNDDCEFTFNDQTIVGTCFTPKEYLPIACKPLEE